MCFDSSSHPESPARNSTSAVCSPRREKVSYVEFSEARNREEHPAQVKSNKPEKVEAAAAAAARGITLALHHGGRIPGISLGQVRCQIPPLCCCQSPPPRRLHQNKKKTTKKQPWLRFPPLPPLCRGVINHTSLTADSSAR